MPAKKSIHLHKLHGTYQPCRHAKREAKARDQHKRTVPVWLPDEVKAIYRKLMACLPPLDAVEETTLAQVAILKHQLEQDPDLFTASQHTQLRQLTVIVREWVEDYRVIKQQEQDKQDDPFETRFGSPIQRQHRQRATNQDFIGPVRRPRPMPENLPALRNAGHS